MNLNESFMLELKMEGAATRKLLERVPAEKFDWKPHEKSMTMRVLATHVAEMTTWLPIIVNENELDFAKMDYKPTIVESTAELLAFFEQNLQRGIESLENVSRDDLMQPWKLRSGDQIFFEHPKVGVIRNMVLNHIVHHRGQLSVYLRLNGVPIPGMYGPSADEQM